MPRSVKGVMHEFKQGELHSGSSRGPVVTNPKQAIAIALSEQRQQKSKHAGQNIGQYLHARNSK